jgi:hypothetical protein
MVSVEQITIEAPKIDEANKNLYIFKLFAENGENLIHECDYLYTINSSDVAEEQMLTIPSKDELRHLSGIFDQVKRTFLESHDEWFEEKITSSAMDDLFKNFLYPNVVENCIDLKISVSSEILNRLKGVSSEQPNVAVFPTFSFDSIVLNVDDNKMNCIVALKDFRLQDAKHDEESPVAEPVGEEYQIENEDDLSELKEVDFDTSNLAKSEMKVNVEDYMIIYKYILGKIKENKIREIENIYVSKNIDMEILDYEDIFNESEDEYLSSDSESEISDD